MNRNRTRLIHCAPLLVVLAIPPLAAQNARASIHYFNMDDVPVFSQCDPMFQLDLDGDSSVDIVFSSFILPSMVPEIPDTEWFATTLLSPNRVLGESRVSLLDLGFFIDSTSSNPPDWQSGADLPIYIGLPDPNQPPCDIDLPGTTGFVGLEFDVGGQTQYGWIRVTAHDATGTGVIRDYAYETTPGMGILAGQIPEPSALILLGLGGLSLLWRCQCAIRVRGRERARKRREG